MIDVLCLFVSILVQKTSERICMKFSGKLSNGPMNKLLNFGVDPYHRSGSLLQHCKTCLGGGMHCPSASSYYYVTSVIHTNSLSYFGLSS